ncbi:MAG TPA: polyketide synthase dehydratase domain-containing protein, partial [Albitalea sp.]|nr:polyketide synthase dehydratase domain-containing protein [Albitalea sp.]
RVPLEFRLAVVAANAAQAIAALRAYADSGVAAQGACAGHRDDLKRSAAASNTAAQLPAWLERRDLASIAAAWVRGVDVEWERLHTAGVRRRVSLPGYVFERQRYWIDKPQPTPAIAALHPLIDANVSTLEEQTFRKTLRPEEFFLRDHRLGDNRVLPAVAYLEMVLQACRLASPHRVVTALRDVSWLKPIVVNGAEETIDIGLLPDADGLRFEIYRLEDAQRLLYANGVVELAAPPEGAPSRHAAGIDLQAVIGRCRAHVRADVTAAFDRMGLHLGPSFQVIDTLYCNANEAYARLVASKPAAAGDWLLHPALLDGAVRTALGVGGLDADTSLRVPVQMRRLELWQPVVGDCGVLAVPSPGVAARADRRHYDVTLINPDGDVLARLEGLAIQAAPQLALMRASAAEAKPGLPAVTAPASRSPADAGVRAGAESRQLPQAVPAPASSAPQSNALTPASVHQAVVRHLMELLSAVTKLPTDQIDAKAPFENYGIDSVMILALTEQLQATYGDVPKTLFYEYQDLHSVADYFVENHAASIAAQLLRRGVTAMVDAAPVPPADPKPAA